MRRYGVAFVAEDDSIDSRVYSLSMMIVRECLSAKLQNMRSCFIRRGRLGLCDIHNLKAVNLREARGTLSKKDLGSFY